MNERIKELAEQARTYARDYVADCKHHGYYMEHNELEARFEGKFAELIVKECSTVSSMFSINKNDIHPDIEWDDMSESAKIAAHSACQEVAIKIKEHFGVE